MGQLLIEPQEYRAKGAVPRKALAAIVVVLLGVAINLYLLNTDMTETKSADQQAVATISSAQNVLAQQSGSPRSVEEAEEAQRREAAAIEAARAAQAAAAASAASGTGSATSMAGGGAARVLPDMNGQAGRRNEGESAEQILAAQDVARRNAPSTAFDFGSDGAAAATGTAAADAAQRPAGGQGPRAYAAAEEAMDRAMRAADRLMPAEAAPSARSAQDAWAQQVSTGPTQARPAALYPAPATAPLMLTQGTLIPAVLTRPLNTDAPGTITAQVSMDVYDSRTARHLLIPKGARLVGPYNNNVAFGQRRIQFAFTRLRMPDDSTYEMPGATGYDQAGVAGAAGNVDRHYLTTFGSALLIGWIADRVTKPSAMPQAGVLGGGGLSATGQVFVDTARTELERYKSTPNTITLPFGERVNVEVVADMVFAAPYKGPRF